MANRQADCVSVIVPTKNRSRYLRQALASIEALRGPDLALDVIVADNGSDDDTRLVAAQFGARLVEAPVPGAAAARNAGLRSVRGEYTAFLDDDDAWLPTHVRPHVSVLRERPSATAVIGQAVLADQAFRPISGPWPDLPPANGDLFAAMFSVCPQIGATVVRTSALHSIGYFDEALVSDEDWDWQLRMARKHSVWFVREPCVLFRQRPLLHDERLRWSRLGPNRRVFFRHVMQARDKRPPIRTLASSFLLQSNSFSSAFLACSRLHLAAGERSAARVSLLRAFASSPAHTSKAIIGSPELRRLAFSLLAPARTL